MKSYRSWVGEKMSPIVRVIIACLFAVATSSCEEGGVSGGGDGGNGGGGGGGGGAGGAGNSCRNKSDCDSNLFCRGPNQPNVCGVPPQEFCESDPGCPMGTVCHAISDGCSLDGIGSDCKSACTANDCGPEFRCNAGGACEPIPCDEGFTCPTWQKCDPMVAHDASLPVHARTSGCVNITCTDDTACPSGKVCVTGYCQDGLGACVEDMAVP